MNHRPPEPDDGEGDTPDYRRACIDPMRVLHQPGVPIQQCVAQELTLQGIRFTRDNPSFPQDLVKPFFWEQDSITGVITVTQP